MGRLLVLGVLAGCAMPRAMPQTMPLPIPIGDPSAFVQPAPLPRTVAVVEPPPAETIEQFYNRFYHPAKWTGELPRPSTRVAFARITTAAGTLRQELESYRIRIGSCYEAIQEPTQRITAHVFTPGDGRLFVLRVVSLSLDGVLKRCVVEQLESIELSTNVGPGKATIHVDWG